MLNNDIEKGDIYYNNNKFKINFNLTVKLKIEILSEYLIIYLKYWSFNIIEFWQSFYLLILNNKI
jgi:hypothetical protein